MLLKVCNAINPFQGKGETNEASCKICFAKFNHLGVSSATDIQRLLNIFDELFSNSKLKPTRENTKGLHNYPEAWEVLAAIERNIHPLGISDFHTYDDIIANLHHPSFADLLWRISPEVYSKCKQVFNPKLIFEFLYLNFVYRLCQCLCNMC